MVSVLSVLHDSANAAGRFLIRGAGRRLSRTVTLLRLIVSHAARGIMLKTGIGVIVSGWRYIQCSDAVSIGDHAELIAAPGKDDTASICLGKAVKVSRRCQLFSSEGGRISIGDYSSIHNNTYLLGDITVGRYCLISANIFISSGDHYAFEIPERLIRDQDRMFGSAQKQVEEAVHIEDDCWIGWGAIVKKGLWIGKGAVIGANSVVTKDVPPYSVVGGQPARVIRSRLDFVPPSRIDALDQATHPYLYRGFMLSQWERNAQSLQQIGALSNAVLVLQKTQFIWCELNGNCLVDELELTIRFNNDAAVKVSIGRGEFQLRIPVDDFTESPGPKEQWSPHFEQWNVFSIHDSSVRGLRSGPAWMLKSFEMSSA